MPFEDRVVNCAAYLQLFPIYQKSFYEHSYGSVPNKGSLKAVLKLQEWLKRTSRKKEKWYIAKLDIAKFFFRIPVEVQLRELAKPLDDEDMMWFLKKAIICDGRPFGLPLDCEDVSTAERISGIGMQVGSLISQMTANVVLTPLDHFIKRELRAPYYVRYMDDIILLLPSKSEAWEDIAAVDEYLQTYLGLQLNQKTAVMPLNTGVEFVGRRVWPGRITIRKQTSLNMKRHLRYIMEHYSQGELPLQYCTASMQSYLGMLQHTDCFALKKKIIEDFKLMKRGAK